MYTISFNGSGGGGGGSSVLIQYQKTVDSSHNTQMVVADYPYQCMTQVEVLAPNMSNPVIDSSRNTFTYYCPAEDSSGNAYIGMDSVTVLEPNMANPVADASVNDIVITTPSVDALGVPYVGMDSVTIRGVTSSFDANIIASNIKEDVTILGVTGAVVEAEYDIIYQRLIAI